MIVMESPVCPKCFKDMMHDGPVVKEGATYNEYVCARPNCKYKGKTCMKVDTRFFTVR
ncbi:hypothetical protein IBTHAUMO2_410005 [Nitrosopumilaceae archaeon]|nr:hypothetical protein [Nitrosopumilus sp.]MDA7944418.1 hypothetical protein [Nitrosopumilus sp.]MDA7973234.1 hypothetical protein [Nitrosopumilus sp.]CAI9831758.1 hypothetical protein IBTHAUMO2_410005 [Nitrosopumilaceae archaeon]